MYRFIFLIVVLSLSACHTIKTKDTTPFKQDVISQNQKATDVLSLGKPVDLSLLQPLVAITSKPDAYLEQRVTIKGKIDKACKKKGCWADIVSSDETLRIKVADDVIVIPLYKIGHDVYATGVLKRYAKSLKETIAHQKHIAEDAGEAFDPSTVTAPLTFYQLETDAIMIL